MLVVAVALLVATIFANVSVEIQLILEGSITNVTLNGGFVAVLEK